MPYILSKTRDGKELADFALDVLRGKGLPITLDGIEEIGPAFDTKSRMEALKWLGERGLGRPVFEVETNQPLLGIVILPEEEK